MGITLNQLILRTPNNLPSATWFWWAFLETWISVYCSLLYLAVSGTRKSKYGQRKGRLYWTEVEAMVITFAWHLLHLKACLHFGLGGGHLVCNDHGNLFMRTLELSNSIHQKLLWIRLHGLHVSFRSLWLDFIFIFLITFHPSTAETVTYSTVTWLS